MIGSARRQSVSLALIGPPTSKRSNVAAKGDESIDLTVFGPLKIARASRVEPDEDGRWWADLGPVRGPKLGPFARRSEALDAEKTWLERNSLTAFGPQRAG